MSESPEPSSSASRFVVAGIVIVTITCVFFALVAELVGIRTTALASRMWNQDQEVFNSVPVIIREYNHDSTAFLQGLEFDNTVDEPRILFESTGLYGRSVIRKYELESGAVLAETPLESRYFGEGLTVAGDEVYVLTWREHTVLVFDSRNLLLNRSIRLDTEGWGICFDEGNRQFIVTDGSDYLHFYSQHGFQLQGRIQVKERLRDNRFRAVKRLNELELIDGKVWANVWMENRIVVINPESGIIENQLDLQHIVESVRQQGYETKYESVLNGIAFHRKSRTLIVSGKLWPKLYQLKTALI